MARKISGECPCGFSFITPHGEDDAVTVLQLHVDRITKKDYPRGVTKAEALKFTKEIQ